MTIHDGCSPLMQAVLNNDLNAVQTLLSAGRIDVNAQNEAGETPLHIGLQGIMNPIETAQVLLQHGADASIMDSNGLSSYHLAREKGIDLHHLMNDNIQ